MIANMVVRDLKACDFIIIIHVDFISMYNQAVT